MKMPKNGITTMQITKVISLCHPIVVRSFSELYCVHTLASSRYLLNFLFNDRYPSQEPRIKTGKRAYPEPNLLESIGPDQDMPAIEIRPTSPIRGSKTKVITVSTSEFLY
jgi:hypothetical protein